MSDTRSKVQEFVLHSVSPILCSVILGFVFYREEVFYRTHPSFQFVLSAVVASVFYNLLVFVRRRDAYAGFILLLFLTFLTTGSTRLAFLLRDILYTGAIGVAVYVYYAYFRQAAEKHYAYSAVTFAGIFGVMNVIAAELDLALVWGFSLETTRGSVVGLAMTSSFFGLMIGFGVGAGITIARVLFGSNKGQ